MHVQKSIPALLALAVAAALSGASAKAQIVNGDFTSGLGGWTRLGSSQTVITSDSPQALLPGAGDVTSAANGAGGITSPNGKPFAVLLTDMNAEGPQTAGAISQTFHIGLLDKIPGSLGNGVGRLRLSTFGGLTPKAQLSFQYQFFSGETKGTIFNDFFKATLNGRQVALTSVNSPNVTPIPNPITISNNTSNGLASPWITTKTDVTSLIGTSATLLFKASDLIDSGQSSGAAVTNVQLTFTPYVLEDADAINSVWNSGLPVVLAQRQILLNVAFNANRDVGARLFRLRSGMDLRPDGAAGPSGDGKESKEAKKEIVPEEKRWAFYATGNYGYRDQNNVDLSAGFQTDLATATIGGEYKLTPSLTVGLAASRVEADNDLGSLGTADVEGWSYDAYVSYAAHNFYADLLYALGTYNNQINRHTGFLGQTATARPDSLTNSIQFNTGYNIPAGRFVTGPLASLNWVHGDIDGYNEQQGGNANLSVPKQHVDSLTSEFGWQLSMPFHTGFGSVTPQVRASWVHDYLNTSKDVTVGLQNSPYYLVDGTSVSRFGSFNATGATSAAGSDYMSVGAGVGIGIGERCSVVVDWEAHFFQNHASSENVSLTGQIKF